MNLTPVFPPDIKPVNRGVYQTWEAYEDPNIDPPNYQHWNGTFWGLACSTADRAEAYAACKSRFQKNQWRGVTKKEFVLPPELKCAVYNHV